MTTKIYVAIYDPGRPTLAAGQGYSVGPDWMTPVGCWRIEGRPSVIFGDATRVPANTYVREDAADVQIRLSEGAAQDWLRQQHATYQAGLEAALGSAKIVTAALARKE